MLFDRSKRSSVPQQKDTDLFLSSLSSRALSNLVISQSTSGILNITHSVSGTYNNDLSQDKKKKLSKRSYLKSTNVLPDWLKARKEFTDGYMHFDSNDLIDKACTCERPAKLRNRYEKKILLEWVSSIPDLCWVSRSRLVEMCDRLMTVYFSKGEWLMSMGDEGDCMFLLLEGIVGVYLESMILAAIVKPNNAIGEASLRVSGNRTATVIAHTDVVALMLKKIDYESIVLREMLQERRDTCEVLKKTKFFSEMPHSKLERLASKVFVKVFEAGHQIYSIGDPSLCIYIIKSGSVRLEAQVKLEQIRKWPSGVRTWQQHKSFQTFSSLIRVCRAGDVFGEKELLGKRERNHSARTNELSVIILINKDTFAENFIQSELQTLALLNEDKPDTPHIVQAVTHKVMRHRQLKKSLLDGLNYNPCPIGRDSFSPKGLRLERLNKLCRK
mmetsp:Transcript_789/g.1548  ORF Transcript_789/g.1548 Transcript_789/m.1548 type:complete len:443 (-) Transcript_789:2000-3328(-)